MADASSSPSLFATLVTVFAGGLLTLAGGWLGPSLLERRREGAEKKKRRADKFENLVVAVYEFDHWLDRLKQIDAFGAELSSEPSPFARLQAISAVYFPQFADAVSELDVAATRYRAWMTDAGVKRLNNRVATMIEGHLEAYKPYQVKRDALLKSLTEFAAREFE
jgi:hypothetical protein